MTAVDPLFPAPVYDIFYPERAEQNNIWAKITSAAINSSWYTQTNTAECFFNNLLI